MQRFSLLFSFFFLFVLSAQSQVNYTANDIVTPYNQPFRPGVNTDFIPGWDNFKLADIAAGSPSLNVNGVGAKAIRPGMFEVVFDFWGYQINRDLFEYYEALGMKEMTALVDFPSDAHRDPVRYCANDPSIPSSLWANMYTPIWDGGANGTPVNDNNYYALFLYKIVTAYKDDVRFWEVMNEPGFDFTGYSGWQQPGVPGNWWDNDPQPCDYKLHAPIEHYVRALRISWEIIKTYDPDSYVLASGLGYPAFLDAVLRNTDNPNGGGVTAEYPLYGGAYFDAVGFHSYPHFDGSLWATGQQRRNSDGAANGVIFKRDEFQQVLTNRGYNGNPYPRKHWLITEINTPRKNITGQYLTEDEGQRNFIIKAIVNSKKFDIKQFHVFSLSDQKKEADATYEFDLFGLYKRLHEEAPYEQKPNNEAHAMHTASDMLFNTTYDATRTAALNLPANVLGGAFRNPDGTFVYVLWAEALQDLSETASKNYTFPAALGISNVQKRAWDYALTNVTQTIAGNNIALTAAPIFLSPSFQQPVCNLKAIESNKVCSNAGTPNSEHDDTYSFDILVTGGSGTGWSAAINGQTITGQHGVTKTVGPFLIFNGITDFVVKDNANPNCTAQVTAGAPLPCSYQGLATNYCASSGSAGQAWIGKFAFGNINKASGNNGYSDYSSDLNAQSRVLQGAGFPVYLTSKYTANTTPQAQYWKVWVDYNHNGVFEDGAETGYQGITAAQAFGTTAAHISGTVNIPSTLTPGPMRMRVAMRQGGYPSPCGAIGTGEVEDYLIIGDNRGGQACTVYPKVWENVCLDQGTPTGADDRYRVQMNVSGWNTGGGWTATTPTSQTVLGRYGEPTFLGEFLPQNGAFTLTVRDQSLGNCQATVNIQAPANCGTGTPTCAISASMSGVTCYNNGTNSNPNDDYFSFSLLVNGSNTGTGWTGTAGGQTISGSYGVAKTFTNFLITNGSVNVQVRDAQTATCVTSLNVAPPASCSGTVPDPPCASASAFPWHEWIAGVKIATLNNPSSKSTFTDYRNLSTNLTAGSSVAIELSTGFSWFAYDEYWKVWVDLNGDGALSDATETVYQGKLNKPADGNLTHILNGQVVIPSGAEAGSRLMRVSMKRGAYPTPCETIPNGEVEDYSVQIMSGTGGTCSIAATTTAIQCNNNGTNTNPNDDTFGFALTVAGSNTGTQGWTATINGQTVTGSFNVAKNLSGYAISSGNLSFVVQDVQKTTCQTTVNVTAPAPCSTGGNPMPCPSVSVFPWHEWIAGVQIGNLNNPSSKSTYSDFSNLSINTSLGATLPVVLTTGYSWQTYNEYWKIWIDYNHDGAFNDATETAYQGILTAPNSGTPSKILSGQIVIPASALTGSAKVRVSMKRGGYPTPCETVPEGEVEAYTINIAQALVQGTGLQRKAEPNTAASAEDGVLIFPNPSSDKVHVEWTGGSAQVFLTDAAGRVLDSQTGFDALDFDVKLLSEGFYLLKIEVWGQRSIVRKISVIR